jgi:hypothetical protein
MLSLFKSKYKFKTAAYRIKIKRNVREARAFRDYLEFVEVDYSERTQSFDFLGTWGVQEPRQINLAAPDNLPETDQLRILANLGDALQKLGYEFIIFKLGPDGYSTGPTRRSSEILLKSQAAMPDNL